jgi:hypothetical protein
LIDLRLVATDVCAKVLPIRQVGNITVPADARSQVEREAAHPHQDRPEPGRYQLRSRSARQRGGSVIYDLDVPDFSKKELSMSGVVLRGPSDPGRAPFPASGRPLSQAPAVQAPTTVRVFRDGDRVGVFAEIYDTIGGRAHTIDVRAVVRNEAGNVTPVSEATWSSDELTKSGGTLRFDAQLPPGGNSLLVATCHRSKPSRALVANPWCGPSLARPLARFPAGVAMLQRAMWPCRSQVECRRRRRRALSRFRIR